MKRKKDFNSKFEDIAKVLETQSKQIEELNKQVNFLMNNDRTAVSVYYDFSGLSMVFDIRAQYIYANKLCDCRIDRTTHGMAHSVVENGCEFAIIKLMSFGCSSYYKLDKKSGTVVDITAEYGKLADIEKSENKKKPKK